MSAHPGAAAVTGTRVEHVLTFLGGPGTGEGAAGVDPVQLGRFAHHFARSGGLAPRDLGAVARVRVGDHRDDGAAGDGCAEVRDVGAHLTSDGQGHLQLRLSTLVDGDEAAVAAHLRAWCHERRSLLLDGEPVVDWVAARTDRGSRVDWAPDVLQVVLLSPVLTTRLRADLDAGRHERLVRLVYRSPGGDFARSPGTMALPRELNREDHQLAAHGRGVLVLGGHPPDREHALRVVASELLFGLARVRTIRSSVDAALARVRPEEEAQLWRRTDAIEELSEEIRQSRISLAVDVESFTDGLFVPEIILDDFRAGFRAKLRLDDFVTSTKAMLDSLAQVVETYRSEAAVAADARREAGQRRWTRLASVATALAVPLGLVLAFFGVSSRATVADDVPIWDLSAYWPVWAVGGLGCATILVATLLPTLRPRPER